MDRKNCLGLLAGIAVGLQGCATNLPKPEPLGTEKVLEERLKAGLESGSAPEVLGIAPAELLEQGLNLSDHYCQEFLQQLDELDRGTGLVKDGLTAGAATGAAFAGINGASSESLGKISAGLVGLLAVFNSYDVNILLAPAHEIGRKLKEGRTLQATSIRTTPPSTVDQVLGVLTTYHASCSPIAIRDMVATSLQNSKYVGAAPGGLTAIERLEIETLEASLYREINDVLGSYTDNQVRSLYAVTLLPASVKVSKSVAEIVALPDATLLGSKLTKLNGGTTEARYNAALDILAKLAEKLKVPEYFENLVSLDKAQEEVDRLKNERAARQRIEAAEKDLALRSMNGGARSFEPVLVPITR